MTIKIGELTGLTTPLTEFALFFYIGHGSGHQYFESDYIHEIRVNACSILLWENCSITTATSTAMPPLP